MDITNVAGEEHTRHQHDQQDQKAKRECDSPANAVEHINLILLPVKPVANPAQGHNPGGFIIFRFNPGAQPAYVHIHRSGSASKIPAPYLRQDLFARQHLAAMAGKIDQQVKFFWLER